MDHPAAASRDDILIGRHDHLDLGRQQHIGEAVHHDSYGTGGWHCR